MEIDNERCGFCPMARHNGELCSVLSDFQARTLREDEEQIFEFYKDLYEAFIPLLKLPAVTAWKEGDYEVY